MGMILEEVDVWVGKRVVGFGFWRKYDAGYTSPCGFGSPYVSRLVCRKCECFRGNAGILCWGVYSKIWL